MTKEETIQILQSIEDRAAEFPNMTACDWVAIAAAKRHLSDDNLEKELEKEDKECINNVLYIFNQLKENSSYKEDNIAERTINWLKSLKDRLYLNNEYDENMLEAILYCIKNNRPLEKEHITWLEKQGKQKYDCSEEDEKIRKRLIDLIYKVYANTNYITRVEHEQIVAWLEKQVSIDKEKMLIGARKDVASSIITYLDRNTLGMCLSNMECEDLVNAVVDSDWGKVYDYMKKKLEKQGDKSQGKTAIEAIKEEKVDNANKVEPKFHEGEWVVDSCGYVWKIKGNNNRFYFLEGVEGDESLLTIEWVEKENTFHLWSIEDAKDGDVLAVTMYPEGTWIGIFKNKDGCTFSSHCFVNTEGTFKLGYHNHVDGKAAHPATKEQRDLLFSKMKEAGYDWLKSLKNKIKNE